MASSLGIIITSLLSAMVSLAVSQPCDTAVNIGDPHRSSAFTVIGNEPFLCDYGRIDEAVWYRVDSYTGSQLYEGCVPRYRCGTEAPVWMNGTHPDSTDPGPKTVQVCSPDVNDNSCCGYWNATIEVQWCPGISNGSAFFVYKLKAVPGCDTAYCAGSGIPCDVYDEIWNPVNQSCSAPYPIQGNPTLTGSIDWNTFDCTTGRVDFSFVCHIGYVSQTVEDGALFEVTLWIDDITYTGLNKTTSSTAVDVTFKSSDIVDSFPPSISNSKLVRCQSKSYWSYATRYKSVALVSNTITIEITPNNMMVDCSQTSPPVQPVSTSTGQYSTTSGISSLTWGSTLPSHIVDFSPAHAGHITRIVIIAYVACYVTKIQ